MTESGSWPTTYRVTVQPDWTPGVYLLVVAPVGAKRTAGSGNVMPLVVQTRAGGKLLAVASTDPMARAPRAR